LTDRLGSIREIANNTTGAFIHEVSYGGFGNVESESSPANGDRYKFTGREFFVEIGLYDYRARTYDAIIGRFNQEDPLFMTDVNPYRYVGNNPVNFIDPLGMVGEGRPHPHHVFSQKYRAKIESLFPGLDIDDYVIQDVQQDDVFDSKGQLKSKGVHGSTTAATRNAMANATLNGQKWKGVRGGDWNNRWHAVLNSDQFKALTPAEQRIKVLETLRDLAEEHNIDLSKVNKVYPSTLKPVDPAATQSQQNLAKLYQTNNVKVDPQKHPHFSKLTGQTPAPTTGTPAQVKPTAPGGAQPAPGKLKQTIKKLGKKLKDNKGNIASVIVGGVIAWIFGQGEQAFAGEPTQGQPGAPAPGNRPSDYADTVGDIAMDTAELYVQNKLTDLILQKLGQLPTNPPAAKPLPTNPSAVKPSVGGAVSNLIVFSWAVDLLTESPAIGTLLGDAINVHVLGREHSADYYETRDEYIKGGDDFMNQNRLEQARRTLLSPVETLMSLTALLGHEIDRGDAAEQIGQHAERQREQMLIDQAQRARPEFDREAQANREKLKADIDNLRSQITKLQAELAERRQAYAASGFFSDLWLDFKQDFGFDRHLDKSQSILEGIRWREASLPGLQERLTQMEGALKQAP
jgi:RHS repeat-associated protein